LTLIFYGVTQPIAVAANIIKGGEPMCEAAVFLVAQGTEKEVMKEVVTVEVKDDHLLLDDILGDRTELKGRIKNIDFLKHRVIVQEV
jgi:predicted RNA-binding protein